MIGTVHSIWEEVYRVFCPAGQFSDLVYEELRKYCSAADSESELKLPYKELIESYLGAGSRVILIRYGLNESEIQTNTNIVLSLVKYLEPKEHMIVDITHSFRSLPMLILYLLLYIKNVSGKKIVIEKILYGMHEAIHETKEYAPIVDLTYLMTISDWVVGAYAFQQYGNGYKISQLLESEDKQKAKILRRFSNIMNLNNLYAIKTEVGNLFDLKNVNYRSEIPSLILNPAVDEYLEIFDVGDYNYRFQFRLACKHQKSRNFALAYMCLVESIVTYVCEHENMDWSDKANRDKAKGMILNTKKYPDILCKAYSRINPVRNSLAHSLEIRMDVRKIIETLKQEIDSLTPILDGE